MQEAITWAQLVGHPIDKIVAINAGVKSVTHTGLIESTHKQYQDQVDKSLENFNAFWKAKVDLKETTQTLASTYGFGMGTNEEVDREFENSVKKWGEAHSTTQSTIVGLQKQNAEIKSAMPTIVNQLRALTQQLSMVTVGLPE